MSLSKKRFRYDPVSREGGAGDCRCRSGDGARRAAHAGSRRGRGRSERCAAQVCEAAGAMRRTCAGASRRPVPSAGKSTAFEAMECKHQTVRD
ncbi:hypothetical protein DF164_27915 [Burkholderia stagnalis]|nr:hypothetical protein DF164_27915 [Burkholderia stagnalis]RQY36323.1 hypothetical protein DF113_26085 [Burkholderia stagnalis]RQY66146.1 hypothetical protein DF110_26680 [Burkholderia stagnalis]